MLSVSGGGLGPRERWFLFVAVAVFGYGTVVHVVQLCAGGVNAYAGLPGVLAGFFASLVVLDPLVAVLLALRLRAGWVLGTVVLVLDAAANAVANYPPLDPSPGVTAGRTGQAVVALLAVGMVVCAPRMVAALDPFAARRR